MKFITALVFLFFSANILAQESSYIEFLKQDSIMKNRYAKGKKYVGGAPGFGLHRVNNQIEQYALNSFFSAGYFVANKTLLGLRSYYDYNKPTKKFHKTNSLFAISSRQSLFIRRYFHPKKFSYFGEFNFAYDNFYQHYTEVNGLPAKWFHIASLALGAGANLYVSKFDIQLGLGYRYPIFYKEEATDYSSFGFIPGIFYIMGLYYTF